MHPTSRQVRKLNGCPISPNVLLHEGNCAGKRYLRGRVYCPHISARRCASLLHDPAQVTGLPAMLWDTILAGGMVHHIQRPLYATTLEGGTNAGSAASAGL